MSFGTTVDDNGPGLHRRGKRHGAEPGMSPNPMKARTVKALRWSIPALIAGALLLTGFIQICIELIQLLYHRISANPEYAGIPDGFFAKQVPALEFSEEHFSNQRAGNSHKSGFYNASAHVNISDPPSWMHYGPIFGLAAPAMDSSYDIYASAYPNEIHALTHDGKLKWQAKIGLDRDDPKKHGSISSPLLLGNYVYVTDGQGYLVKLHKDTGEVQWRIVYTWYGEDGGVSAVVGIHQTVIVTGTCSHTLQDWEYCKTTISALDARDGHVLWKVLGPSPGPIIHFNKNPTVTEDLVLIMDRDSIVYCYDLFDGELRFGAKIVPPELGKKVAGCAGHIAVGPDKFYASCSWISPDDEERGVITAFDLKTGKGLWFKAWPFPMYTGPSLYVERGRTYVLQGHGQWQALEREPEGGYDPEPGGMLGLDGDNGDIIWQLDAPPVPSKLACQPHQWSPAAIDTHGTAYTVRYDGTLYVLNVTTGALMTTKRIGSGSMANPIIAPNMLAFTDCYTLWVYKSPDWKLPFWAQGIAQDYPTYGRLPHLDNNSFEFQWDGAEVRPANRTFELEEKRSLPRPKR